MLLSRRSQGAAPAPFALGVAAALGLAVLPAGQALAFVPIDRDTALGSQIVPTPAESGQPAAAGTAAPGAGTTSTTGSTTGPDASQVRIGAFGLATEALPPPAPADATSRAYTITPSIGLQLLATDNVFQVSSPRRADLVTQISPGILATAETLRLRGSLNYTPLIQLYASNGDQSRVSHVGNGQALLEMLPGLAFLDVRGATAIQSSRGGFRPEGTAVQDNRDQVQTTSLQVSPYLLKRFGGDATLLLGYALQYSDQDGDRSALQNSNQPYFTAQNFVAHEGRASLSSGENFGRLAFEAQADGTTYSGTGVLSGAHKAYASVEARYAFIRGVAGLVELGYEDQEYGGVPRVRISDPIWAVGVRLTPAPDSVITAKYGHRDGFDSAFLDAGFNVGPRTRVFAGYIDALQTVAQQSQDLLSNSTVDEAGNLVSATTRAPVFYGDSALAVQGGLFRTRRFTGSVTHAWPRDAVTLSVFYERRLPVATTPGLLAFEQSSISGSASWSHELTPDTSSLVSLQYGRTTQQGSFQSSFGQSSAGDSDVFTFSAALVHQFGRDLTGTVQYVLTNRQGGLLTSRGGFVGGFDTGNSLQNVVIAGIRKSF